MQLYVCVECSYLQPGNHAESCSAYNMISGAVTKPWPSPPPWIEAPRHEYGKPETWPENRIQDREGDWHLGEPLNLWKPLAIGLGVIATGLALWLVVMIVNS